MIYDYKGQLSRLAATIHIAEDLYNVWASPRIESEGDRVIEFGTLTSRVGMPLDFWDRVMSELFIEIYDKDIGSTGMYSIEKTEEGQFHGHFVAVRGIRYDEYCKVLMDVWKENVGFHKVQPARNLPNVAGYTIKEWIDGESKSRDLAREPVFFGEAWTRRGKTFVWEQADLPGFEAVS